MHLLQIVSLITQLIIACKTFTIQPIFVSPSRYQLGESGMVIDFHVDSTFIISWEHQSPTPTNTYPVKYGEWAWDHSDATLYILIETWDNVRIKSSVRQAWKLEHDDKTTMRATLIRCADYQCAKPPIPKSITRWTLVAPGSDHCDNNNTTNSTVPNIPAISGKYMPCVRVVEHESRLDMNSSHNALSDSTSKYCRFNDGGLHDVLSDSISQDYLFNDGDLHDCLLDSICPTDGDDWAWVDKLEEDKSNNNHDTQHHDKNCASIWL